DEDKCCRGPAIAPNPAPSPRPVRSTRRRRNPHVQTLADEPLQRPIDDPFLDHLHQHLAIDAVEEGLDVNFQDPAHLPSKQHPVHGPQRVVRAAAPTKAIRAIMENRLVNRLEQLAQRFLHNLVLGRRDADRATLAVLLRNVNPTDWLVPPPLRPQPARTRHGPPLLDRVRVPSVPRCHRSYAVLRLLVPIDLGYGLPCLPSTSNASA